MAAFHYEGSPAGAEGYYYVLTVNCDPRIGPERRVPTRDEVERECDDQELRRIARQRTTAPTTILAHGVDSVYF